MWFHGFGFNVSCFWDIYLALVTYVDALCLVSTCHFTAYTYIVYVFFEGSAHHDLLHSEGSAHHDLLHSEGSAHHDLLHSEGSAHHDLLHS